MIFRSTSWIGALMASGAVLFAWPAALAQTSGFADVDPFIGTGPDGHTFPGAVVPFGMVQPSPDTLIADFKHSYTHAAGYRFGDPTIQGFSQTHFSGTGHSDLGDFELMPIAGEVKLDPGAPDQPGSGYRSRYSHDSEKAEPGYYAVTLSGLRREGRVDRHHSRRAAPLRLPGRQTGARADRPAPIHL